MAKTDDNLVWRSLDATSLDPQSQKLYAKLKAAREAANEAKQAFEESVRDRADIPKGKRLVFGYKFGKLSAALADDTDKPKVDKSAISLTDFMAAQDAGGRRR